MKVHYADSEKKFHVNECKDSVQDILKFKIGQLNKEVFELLF